MRVSASTVLNTDSDSEATGTSAAQGVVEEFGADKLSMLLVHGTINHAQAVLYRLAVLMER